MHVQMTHEQASQAQYELQIITSREFSGSSLRTHALTVNVPCICYSCSTGTKNVYATLA